MDMEKGYKANVTASSFREQLKRKLLHIVSNSILNLNAYVVVHWYELKMRYKILTPSLSNFNSGMTFTIVNPNFKKIMTHSRRLWVTNKPQKCVCIFIYLPNNRLPSLLILSPLIKFTNVNNKRWVNEIILDYASFIYSSNNANAIFQHSEVLISNIQRIMIAFRFYPLVHLIIYSLSLSYSNS